MQSRPITTRMEAPPVLWSSANVNENFPAPVSPLLYSIARAGYYHYFRNLAYAFGFAQWRIDAMEQPLRHIIGVHRGRIYYNLTSIHAVLRAAPFGDYLTGLFSQFVGAPAAGAAPRGAVAWRDGRRSRLGECRELAVMLLKTARQYLGLGRRVEVFEGTVAAFAARTQPRALERKSLLQLRDDLRAFMDIRCRHWTNAALADAAAMVCSGVLRGFLCRAFPDPTDAGLATTLLKGIRDLVSMRPAVDLWTLSRAIRRDPVLQRLVTTCSSTEAVALIRSDPSFASFRHELENYLEQWGFRRSGELMLTVPDFAENPATLLEILRSYVSLDGGSPQVALERQVRERETATARALTRLRRHPLNGPLPWLVQTWALRLLLRWTHRAIALRERARLKQALLYTRCRRIALAMGDRLVTARVITHREDVFFLTCEELDDLVSGHAMFPYHPARLVALRRAEHSELARTAPPDTLTLAEGRYLPPEGIGVRDPSHQAGRQASSLAGTPACGGQVRAPAAVLADTSEAGRLARGDVLVTRQTDPGWGPLFFLIGGLVIERGGLLSHGAILAREYGIPTVVGVLDATRLIPHGHEVTVDGDRGLVHLVG